MPERFSKARRPKPAGHRVELAGSAGGLGGDVDFAGLVFAKREDARRDRIAADDIENRN